jgi:hypothetical protein
MKKPTYPCSLCGGSGAMDIHDPGAGPCGACDGILAGNGRFFVEDMVWVTKDKQRIRFKDLSDTHLANILSMLQRGAITHKAAQVAKCLNVGSRLSEHAADAVDSQMFDLMRTPWHKFAYHQYRWLNVYARWRGVKWPKMTRKEALLLETKQTLILTGKAKVRTKEAS